MGRPGHFLQQSGHPVCPQKRVKVFACLTNVTATF